ncbi:MAG: SGNH/GDSL hydrolase family protein [Ignavibacteria bacterium]|nr:SGNH/GDSL hydrolase family protein [Ignavibacteria bacterium]
MKKILNVLFSLSFIALVFVGCEDRSDIAGPTSGTASYDRFVTIGNSITAGYQSGALYKSAQDFAYGKLIAKQVGASFEMPTYSDPGTGGRMELTAFNLATSTPTIVNNPNVGAPTNLTYAAPYNNLGIPGALLYDVLNAKDSLTCASALLGVPSKPNAMFNLVLRNIGTQFEQAKALNPTLVTLWIGNNDVLGFATSGGFSPTSPTPAATFDFLYRALADSVKSLNAKVVVANLPDVTAIPFFNTVGPKVALGTPWTAAGVTGIYYQKHAATAMDATAKVDSLGLLTGKVDLTLVAGSFVSFLKDTTGAAWTALAAYLKIPVSYVKPAFVDVSYPFGFHPLNPFPDVLTLDADEITTAKTATASFNASIDSIARNRGFAIVNINTFFNQIRANDKTGTYYGGIKFTTGYISGGLFSLDGVHPSNHGHAIIANEFIKVINSKWGGNIPLVNVASIDPSFILGKRISFDNFGIPKFQAGAFDHLLF